MIYTIHVNCIIKSQKFWLVFTKKISIGMCVPFEGDALGFFFCWRWITLWSSWMSLEHIQRSWDSSLGYEGRRGNSWLKKNQKAIKWIYHLFLGVGIRGTLLDSSSCSLSARWKSKCSCLSSMKLGGSSIPHMEHL